MELRSVLRVRKAQNIAIGAELVEERLLVGQDLALLCLSDELDHVALLGVALLVDERGPIVRMIGATM
jgi:hypothetical protein